MNQDFVLDLTPGLARRLVRIGQSCKLDLDPTILAMAREDLLPASAFSDRCPDIPMRRAAMQWIVDCGCRCAIPGIGHDELDRWTILQALIASGVTKVTVATNTYGIIWLGMLQNTPLKPNSRIMAVRNLFEEESQQDRRDGVLILDWGLNSIGDINMELMAGLCREFPRTILHVDPKAPVSPEQLGFAWMQKHVRQSQSGHVKLGSRPVVPWWDMGVALFPDMPNGLFALQASQLSRDVIYRDAWKSTENDDISLFYNVFLPQCLPNYGAISV